jgi:hypothetical protein
MSLGKFCLKCKKESDDTEAKKPICEPLCNDGKAVCTKYDLDAVASSIPTPKKSDGGNPDSGEFSSTSLTQKNGKIYFRGESRLEDERDIDFELKYENDIWSFKDPEKEGGAGWIPFSEYLTSNTLYEQNIKTMENKKSLSDMIEEKLRDVYFYSVSEKGKERIKFDLEDKRNILQHL